MLQIFATQHNMNLNLVVKEALEKLLAEEPKTYKSSNGLTKNKSKTPSKALSKKKQNQNLGI